MIDNRVFSGKMNLDSDNYRMPQGDYKYALNITRDARGIGQDQVVSNIVGNRIIDDTLPSGTNKVIGYKEDLIRNRVYLFVWNSGGYHSIRYIDKGNETISVVLLNLTDSSNIDILGFDPSWRINHIDIIYRDDDGDLVFWTDGKNRPFFINEKDAINNLYGTNWKQEYITVARPMPLLSPIVSYQNDAAVLVNNLRKTLYEFRYRWVYKDLTKSTWSPYSKLIAPSNPDDIATNIDPTKNNYISVEVLTGDADVIKIQIAAREILGANVFSDDYIISTIEKGGEVLSNSIYTHKFFNDAAYEFVDPDESLLLFDYVPLKAYTQALPNGNVLAYAAVTEGINFNFNMDVDGSVGLIEFLGTGSLSVTNDFLFDYTYGFTLFGAPMEGDLVVVNLFYIEDSVEYFQPFVYNVLLGDTISDVRTALFTAINAFDSGNTFQATMGGEQITVLLLDNTPIRTLLSQTQTTVTLSPAVPSVDEVGISIYKHKSKYRFGLVYFDKYGVTDGYYTSDEFLITTPELTTTGGLISDIPNITFDVHHKPPINATNFSWVRTLNQTVATMISMVSCGAKLDGTSFQYLNITNLINNESNFTAYEFSKGDRVRVIGAFSAAAAGTVNVWDFPIIDLVIDPTAATPIPAGTYIKIPYNSTALLVVDTKYLIEIYTPALNTDAGGQIMYEFGETYKIINAGAENRSHSGSRQNQSGVTTSAIVAPVAAPTVAVAASAGNLGIGDYYYKVAFGDANGNISAPSVASLVATTSGGNQQVNLSVIPTGAAGVTKRFIYRTKVDGAEYFLLATINDNTTTTYTDNIADTSITDAMPQPAVYNFSRGDFYSRSRNFPTDAAITVYNTINIVDVSVSDLYPSNIRGNGRAFAINSPAQKEIYYPTVIRFGGEFQQNTNINDTNRFQFDDQDNYDRANGDVRKLHVEGRSLFVFQKFDIGVVPIFTQVIRDTSGNPLESNSNILLNKIQYPYKGKFGIGDVPESFAYYRNAKYFIDPNKGAACRLSQDGVTPISVVYGCNAFFAENTSAYRDDLNTGIAPTGGVYMGDPKILGVFDYYTNKYIVSFEEINRYSSPTTLSFHQDPYTLVFLDSRDSKEGFETFASFLPEGMVSIATMLITFKGGRAYIHDNESQFCNFYGVQYGAEIGAVFNDNALQKKTFVSVGEVANTAWECPEIKTSMYSFGITNQSSRIPQAGFRQLESMYHSSFRRDENSAGGIWNGNQLKGNWLYVKFRVANASNFVTLNMVSMKYINSPLTSM